MMAVFIDKVQNGSLPLSLHRQKSGRRGAGVGWGGESGVGGGVGWTAGESDLFFQWGERRTVMCAELMTKGPFMCSVCR